VKKSTTISITNDVRDKLLELIHDLENQRKVRLSYSDVINYLLGLVRVEK
jgi:predicted CopG family antitoxin